MNIFGIGPLEIIFVLIIGILVLGPEGMIEAGRKLGKFIRSIIRSTWWQNIRRGVNELQHLPHKLMREAELDELLISGGGAKNNELTRLDKNDFPKIGKVDLFEGSTWAGNDPSPQKDKSANNIDPAEKPTALPDH